MTDNRHKGRNDRAALSAMIKEFFDRMADDERRGTVGDLFSKAAVITLPGARFEGPNAPEEMLAFFATRYEWAAKDFDRWYVDLEQGVVVSVGTLYGVDNAGEPFEDVRYVDMYELVDGEITRMDVYNDLTVEGVVES